MKPLVTSTILHTAILTWGLWTLGAPEKLEMGGEALPVTLITDVSEATLGEQDAPEAEKSAPKPTETPEKLPMPAENVGDNEVDLATPPAPKAAPRENVRTADAPPPAPAPPTPQAKPTPPEPPAEPAPVQPPEPLAETAEVKPEPAPPETAPEIDPLAAEIAKAEAETPAPPRNVPLPQVKPKPPEPVRVAEAKPPEPIKEIPKTPVKEPAKESAKAPEKAKEPKKPTTKTGAEKQFDADEISALLNKQDSTGGGAKRTTAPAAKGASRQTGATLSQSDKDALLSQLRNCWSIPGGVMDPQSLKVSVRFNLDTGGKLTGAPQVEASSGNRTFDESAVRAIRKCDNQGLAVPAGKESEWAEIIIDFNPSEMF